MASFGERLRNAWNAFVDSENTPSYRNSLYSPVTTFKPDRIRMSRGNDRSIVTALYNRISMDVAAISIRHVRLDDLGRYNEDVDSELNRCLTLNANADQTSRAFVQDLVMSMLDEGHVAIVPVDTNVNPRTNAFDVLSLRAGKVVAWYPKDVKIRLYNERTGTQEEVILPKAVVPIIENPFYSVMNEPNSTLQRLIRKLNLLDVVDELTSSGKLDLIIQLPYSLKTEARIQQAEIRRNAIQEQLTGSKYGIAYIDSTEHVTQLNRPVENNLMNQIEYLTSMLYSQLGMTSAILDGTANAEQMNNYHIRTVEPIISAICDGMRWKFLSKTARTRGQSIAYFRDPFKLIPVVNIGNTADAFTRNAIMSSNEFRAILGLKPSDNPEADELRNKNLNRSKNEIPEYQQEYMNPEEEPAFGEDKEYSEEPQ